jgi:hypothetical protein
VVIPHITQVLQQCSQWSCRYLSLLSSSEQQTSKLCLKIHISVSQHYIVPPPKILILPGNILKLCFRIQAQSGWIQQTNVRKIFFLQWILEPSTPGRYYKTVFKTRG